MANRCLRNAAGSMAAHSRILLPGYLAGNADEFRTNEHCLDFRSSGYFIHFDLRIAGCFKVVVSAAYTGTLMQTTARRCHSAIVMHIWFNGLALVCNQSMPTMAAGPSRFATICRRGHFAGDFNNVDITCNLGGPNRGCIIKRSKTFASRNYTIRGMNGRNLE